MLFAMFLRLRAVFTAFGFKQKPKNGSHKFVSAGKRLVTKALLVAFAEFSWLERPIFTTQSPPSCVMGGSLV